MVPRLHLRQEREDGGGDGRGDADGDKDGEGQRRFGEMRKIGCWRNQTASQFAGIGYNRFKSI